MTQPVRKGAYRLWRQKEGRSAYADVHVEVHEDPKAMESVTWAVDAADSGSAQRDTDRDEVAAALRGVIEALESLHDKCGIDTSRQVVKIMHVGINLADTTPDAVHVAAAAATASAFGAGDYFKVAYDADGWKYRYILDN